MVKGLNRKIPRSVARALRKEANFGCVLCGNAFLEYHHIIEWREVQHFEIEHMVAVCGACHHRFGRMTKERQYRKKQNPINRHRNRLRGYLEFDVPLFQIEMGSCRFVDSQKLLGFNNRTIFAWSIEDGEFKVDLRLVDKFDQPILEIEKNDIVFAPDKFWDFDFKYNRILARSKDRRQIFDLDFRRQPASIQMVTYVKDRKVSLTKDRMFIEADEFEFDMRGGHFENLPGYVFHFYDDAFDPADAEKPIVAMIPV